MMQKREEPYSPPIEILLNEKEVARILRRSVASIRRDRLLRRGCAYVKLGALVRYRKDRRSLSYRTHCDWRTGLMLGTSFESVSSLPENGDRSVRANVTRDRQKEHEREQETTRNQLYYGN